jgi:anion-transporting  ArsA/GET3 family ATPase
MAMEKLYAVRRDPNYDLILLDTPPTANALDFLDAPERLVGAIDSAAMRWFVQAFQSSGKLSFNLLAKSTAAILKRHRQAHRRRLPRADRRLRHRDQRSVRRLEKTRRRGRHGPARLRCGLRAGDHARPAQRARGAVLLRPPALQGMPATPSW